MATVGKRGTSLSQMLTLSREGRARGCAHPLLIPSDASAITALCIINRVLILFDRRSECHVGEVRTWDVLRVSCKTTLLAEAPSASVTMADVITLEASHRLLSTNSYIDSMDTF
jgi:hypothetical protein